MPSIKNNNNKDPALGIIGHYQCPQCKTTSIVLSAIFNYAKPCAQCKIIVGPHSQVNLVK